MGARLGLLLRLLWSSGGVEWRHLPLASAMVGFAALRAPLGLAERVWCSWRPQKLRVSPPVFVVGHWRSGTTHLHNILGQDPQFAHISPLASGLPNELLTIATWFRPWLEKALPEDRHIDRVAVAPDSPQEDEIPFASIGAPSVFHALYFPAHFQDVYRRAVFPDPEDEATRERWVRFMKTFYGKVVAAQGKSRLLVKNPVYTGRLNWLQQAWPGCKIVAIHRNPFDVYHSTVHYYRKMLEELALQTPEDFDLEEFVLASYPELMARFDEDAADMSRDTLAQIRFEDLEREPMKVVEELYAQLELGDFSAAKQPISNYLNSLAGYQKNRFTPEPDAVARVADAWAPWVSRWGYSPPHPEPRS